MIGRALLVALALAGLLAAPASAARFVAERTGGIAGVSDRLVVTTGGDGWRSDRAGERVRLRPADTRALRRALKDARFATLRPRYAPEGTIADAFEYRLRHRGQEVVVVETADDVPPRLQRLLDAVGVLLMA